MNSIDLNKSFTKLKNQIMNYIPFNQLKVGQQFRFTSDTDKTIRTVSQIGRTEIYCPIDGSNTMGHSKEGGEEVYLKNSKEVILLDAEPERQLIEKGSMFPLFDEAHNMGIQRCIDFVKSQEQMYRSIAPDGLSAITCEAIWKTLEHFKKPIPSPEKETI